MADYKIDDTVDITDVVCPVTFVKAKVALEELDDGQILAVRMNNGEPVQNVPRSIKEEGDGLHAEEQGPEAHRQRRRYLHSDRQESRGRMIWHSGSTQKTSKKKY